MSRVYVVRVVIPAIDQEHAPPLAKSIPTGFLEALRVAQVVVVHTNNDDRQTFDIPAPAGVPQTVPNTRQWAEMVAEYMRTFGFNAVAAPSTE